MHASLWIILASIAMIYVAIELWLSGRRTAPMSPHESLRRTLVVTIVTLGFTFFVALAYDRRWFGLAPETYGLHSGSDAALRFLTAWVVEHALSLDNLFMFAVLFSYFRLPAEHQPRVFALGLVAMLAMRGFLIWTGITLVHAYDWVPELFGALLLLGAFRILIKRVDSPNLERNPVVRLLAWILPLSETYDHNKLVTRLSTGALALTPFMVVVCVAETSDAVLALDSIPAVIGVTRDPFLVLTSNLLAVLSLRQLYFWVAAALLRFRFLKVSLVFLLMFMGAKMLMHDHAQVSPLLSLGVTLGAIAAGIIASLIRPAIVEVEPTPLEDLALAAELTWKRTRKWVILVIGVTLFLFGLIFGILPGVPGIPIMLIALALLATEFVWAQVALKRLKNEALRLKAKAQSLVGGSAPATPDMAPPAPPPSTDEPKP